MDDSKQETIVTGIKLKLNFDNIEDKMEMNKYFDEYSKIVTFAARKINELRKGWDDIKSKKVGDKWVSEIGTCDFCKNEAELKKENRTNHKRICWSCYNKEYGKQMVRKKIMPTERGKNIRKVDSSLNVKNAGNVSLTTYHLASRDASQLLSSLDKQKKRRRDFLKRDLARLKMFEEMLKDETKRVQLPMTKRMKVPRFVHVKYKDNAGWRGWRMNDLQNKVKLLIRNTERTRKSLDKATPISHSGTKISLHNDTIFNIDENKVKIKLWKPKWYNFNGTNVVNNHGIEFFKEKLSKIKPKKYGILIKKIKRTAKLSEMKTETYIIPLLIKGKIKYVSPDDVEFYLQYPVEEIIAYHKPTSIMGLDVGLNKIAALSVFNLNDLSKPTTVKLFSGKEITMLRYLKRKHERMLRNKHHRSDKLKRFRPIQDRVDQIYHTIAKQIVDIADNNNSIIALESLYDMKKKLKIREYREQRFIRSMFVYQKIRGLIEYKAKLKGIATVEVDPEGTSYTCSKCGSVNTSRPKQAIFICHNAQCKIFNKPINADYNASCNIAQKGLKVLNSNN